MINNMIELNCKQRYNVLRLVREFKRSMQHCRTLQHISTAHFAEFPAMSQISRVNFKSIFITSNWFIKSFNTRACVKFLFKYGDFI